MPGYDLIEGNMPIDKAKIAVVASCFNNYIVERLLSACIDTLNNAGLGREHITVVRVPGAFELPLAAQTMMQQDNYDAAIALGVIIRGETPHFEHISRECSRGLSRIALDHNKPVIFGVLTVDNADQALARAGEEESNKGAEAALAAIEMINVLRKIK